MLMSVAEIRNSEGVYPELAGTRVLITGVGPTCGVDVARAFADHSCRLLLQIPEPCPETDALLAVLADVAPRELGDDALAGEEVAAAATAVRRACTGRGASVVVVCLLLDLLLHLLLWSLLLLLLMQLP